MTPKTILFAATFLLLPFMAFTQSAKEIDHVLMTSWEPLLKGLTNKWPVQVQCTKANSDIELGFKMMWVDGAVDEGAQLQFTLENDSIVTLYNQKFSLPCTGCGATRWLGSASPGFYLKFSIPPSEASALSSRKLKKIRLYMHDGYIEDNIKGKSVDIIRKELDLLK